MEAIVGNKRDKIWVIAYINSSHLTIVEKQLKLNPAFNGVIAHIPTVRILRKQTKGRLIYHYVPLLFNYGFFEIPKAKFNAEYLSELKKGVEAIYDWVKDPAKLLKETPSIRVVKNKMGEEFEMPLPPDLIKDNPIGTASAKEVERLVNLGSEFSIYDKSDLSNIGVGSIVTLKGYPFEDMPAMILEIDSKNERVKVELLLDALVKRVSVTFDNVFYTIYSGGYDETLMKDSKEKNIEDLKRNPHSTDKLYNKNQNHG